MYPMADTDEMTPDRAERILASILVNHDTVPTRVMLTATLVQENNRTMTYGEAAEVLKSVAPGTLGFDADGEIIWKD